MRRIFIFTLLALTMAGGVASADRGHYRRDHRSGGVSVQRAYPRHTYRPTYRQSYRYTRPAYRQHYRPHYQSRVYVQPRAHIVRRPIYVQRPIIRHRYYNYYQRPAVVVENYPPMSGYIWIAGQWTWNGYEWIWQPGHYQPDPGYGGYPYAPNGTYYNGDGWY